MQYRLIAGAAGALVAASSATAQMRITEWMYSGAGDEFIEFTNVGDTPIDMTGWSYDDESQTPGTEDLSALGIVMPGQSVVITEDTPENFRLVWGLDESCVVRGLIKANIGRNDEINLYDASDMLVDTLTYGDEDFPGSIRTQGVSGWGQAFGIGLNDVYSFVFSKVGDVQGSTMSSLGDIGSPCSHVLVNAFDLSEIRIDQPTTDADEYVEIRGAAGLSVDDLTLVVIGDGTGGSGVIDAAIALSGVIPADGHYLATEDTFTLADAAQQDLVTDLDFENGDNVTFVLVDGFTGAAGDDLDTDDDCVLDVVPWANEYDRVALIEEENPPSGTECHYGSGDGIVGPDGTFVPGHVFRCDPTDAWAIGIFDPAMGDDTPGEPNAACPALVCEENDLRLNELRFDQPGGDDDEYLEITGTPGTSLDGTCVVVIGDSGSTDLAGFVDGVIDLSGLEIPGDGTLLVAEDADTFGEVADLVTSLPFENGDNLSIFLVCDCQAVVVDADLDADDDGTLDMIPWGLERDSITIFGTDGVEPAYSDTIVVGGVEVPAHVLRCLDGDAWGVGNVDPLLSVDTPGLANADCPDCLGDLDGSGDVGFGDLVIILAAWGPCGTDCPQDLDGDGDVGFGDVIILLAAWGPC